MISHKYKYIYIRIPKCASTSIVEYLQSLEPETDLEYLEKRPELRTYNNHIPAHKLRELVGDEIWNTYYKFTIVRNPYDWFVSQYFDNQYRIYKRCCYMENNMLSGLKNNKINLWNCLQLEMLLSDWFNQDRYKTIYNQSYFTHYNNNSYINIGKYENLVIDLYSIFSEIHPDIVSNLSKLEHKNRSTWKHDNYSSHLTHDAIEFINLYNKQDFELFSYNNSNNYVSK